jgi:hypothetical protein
MLIQISRIIWDFARIPFVDFDFQIPWWLRGVRLADRHDSWLRISKLKQESLKTKLFKTVEYVTAYPVSVNSGTVIICSLQQTRRTTKLLHNFELNKFNKQANLLLPVSIHQVWEVVEVLYGSWTRLRPFQVVGVWTETCLLSRHRPVSCSVIPSSFKSYVSAG